MLAVVSADLIPQWYVIWEDTREGTTRRLPWIIAPCLVHLKREGYNGNGVNIYWEVWIHMECLRRRRGGGELVVIIIVCCASNSVGDALVISSGS